LGTGKGTADVSQLSEIAFYWANQISFELESKWRLIQAKGATTQFACPVCSFQGRFVSDRAQTGWRYAAMCPRCRSMERHRLQILTMNEIRKSTDLSGLSLLHLAPEPALSQILRPWFARYTTGDIDPQGVDIKIDLTRAGNIPDDSYDVIYASHVLEHIVEDELALSEIVRMLKPGGFAVLPVPLVGETTIEYPGPIATEFGHVRAPGYDYYDRYKSYFSTVTTYSSEDFDERYQVYIYEDRSRYPTRSCPYRIASAGARHRDVVPVAYL
jgi:SAM-dependent methyltransferase